MFDRLLGNEPIKKILRRMLEKGRVPRSFLFAGADGVGKRRFALELARAFVCQNPRGVEACGACMACGRVEKFVFPAPDAKKDEFEKVFFSEHIDIGTVIPCRSNILVGAIRELEKEANFRPYEAKARFFIIDEADKMNDAASNALLKTLEEPSATSYLFLISARPDTLLQTIRSRCQTLRFAPIPAAEIKTHLLSTKKFSPDDAELLARLSTGSIGRALSIDLSKFRARREAMVRAVRSADGDYLTLLKSAEEMSEAKSKEDFELYLETLQTLIHDVWALKLGQPDTSLVNLDILVELKNLAARIDSRKLSKWLGEIEILREQLAVNLNKKIASDALFMKMAH